MYQFSLFGFPVRVHWTFGLMALFIGGGIGASSTGQWAPVLVAVAVIFVSILVHELGHALAGRRFGARPHILLHSMGGLCYLPGARFNRNQSILVSLAGPAGGFLLAVLTWVLASTFVPEHPLIRHAIFFSLFANVAWTFLNLLPILPLDGGQVLRDLLGPSRIQATRIIGAITASALALLALNAGQFILAALAGVLAFLNFKGNSLEGGVVKETGPTPAPQYDKA